MYHVYPACAASHFDDATRHRFSEIATAMMVALAIHCMAGGLALAAGHEAHIAQTPGGSALDFSLVLAEAKLKEAYDGIRRQNEAITNLVSQRDEFISKYNDSVRDRNRVVAKDNELVEKLNKQQSATSNQ